MTIPERFTPAVGVLPPRWWLGIRPEWEEEGESWSFADGLRCSPCQPGHLSQVTWYGHPLYLFSHEQLTPLRNGAGADRKWQRNQAFGGTFSLVVNP